MTRRRAHVVLPLAGLLASVLLAGCAGAEAELSNGPARPTPTLSGPAAAPSEPAGPSSGESAATSPSDSPTPSTSESPVAAGTTPAQRPHRAREPRRSYLSIPALGLRSVPVVRYRGIPDDAKGTRIQNRGPTASPRGPGGGVGPGDVGNFIVTGHRTSHAAPFRNLPALHGGDRVRVRSGRTVFVYRITATRSTSFRSPRSLAEQSAAVPGHPSAEPVRPMITLSTCATLEDHAAGNYWADRFGNPEHRIDKVGVLVARSRTGA